MTPVRLILAIGVLLTLLTVAVGQEPSWTGPIVKRGEDRVQTNHTPIENRPYRPFHVYGNTVRRIHYRSQALPRPKDAIQGTAAFVSER